MEDGTALSAARRHESPITAPPSYTGSEVNPLDNPDRNAPSTLDANCLDFEAIANYFTMDHADMNLAPEANLLYPDLAAGIDPFGGLTSVDYRMHNSPINQMNANMEPPSLTGNRIWPEIISSQLENERVPKPTFEPQNAGDGLLQLPQMVIENL